MTLVEKLVFYEWAYGHLAKADSDSGPLGEFVVLLSHMGWRTAELVLAEAEFPLSWKQNIENYGSREREMG